MVELNESVARGFVFRRSEKRTKAACIAGGWAEFYETLDKRVH